MSKVAPLLESTAARKCWGAVTVKGEVLPGDRN